MQLIFRIILSPIILFMSFFVMCIPGPICLGSGIINITLKLLGIKIDDKYSELLLMTFIWIYYLIINTKNFIINAEFIN